jgi:hypothetical protein
VKTTLPVADWREVIDPAPVRLLQPRKSSGDVNLAELAVLASAAAATRVGEEIIEISTFDAEPGCKLPHLDVFTLDLPPDVAPKFALAQGESAFVQMPRSGRHFREAPAQWAKPAGRITQLFGDSATFDWSAHFGRAGLVFVDGSHAYDYVVADTDTALRLVANKGMVIWHDFGVWDGVTRALEEIEASRHLGLRHVRGTSLVAWESR